MVLLQGFALALVAFTALTRPALAENFPSRMSLTTMSGFEFSTHSTARAGTPRSHWERLNCVIEAFAGQSTRASSRPT